jgi:hypothetical protein
MDNNQKEIFFKKLENVINSRELLRLLVNSPRNKSSDLKSLIIKIAMIKRDYKLKFIYRHSTKDITKNYEFAEGIEIVKKILETDFYNAEIFAINENVRLLSNHKGKIKIISKKADSQPAISFSHDRLKERPVSAKGNIYLRELGITNANWELKWEMSDKYKQINRYIELLEPEIKEIDLPDTFQVTDMGSGKGYLTFALYDYLSNVLGKTPKMTGVEEREELVSLCNTIALKADFNNLHFVKGTIENTELEKIDILIALHACDTATDDAIYRGIVSNASLIVVSPCCHKQIRNEMNVTNELKYVVKHGILKERQAEILTDSIRAMIMEAFGYKTKVFEFISTEHTPKNLMIVGRKVKKENQKNQEILKNIASVKEFYGIGKHYLETLLNI